MSQSPPSYLPHLFPRPSNPAMAEPQSAALRAPLEIWYRILDILLQPANLFDPTNPIHSHHHFRNDWNREIRHTFAYRSVCRAWWDYLRLVPQARRQEVLYRTGADRMEDAIPHPGVIWLEYVTDTSHTMLNPSTTAPDSIFISTDSPIPPPGPIQQKYDSDEFFLDLSRIRNLRSLSLETDESFRLMVNIARNLRTLVALTVRTGNIGIFMFSNDLSFPCLQILDIRPQSHSWRWDYASLASWSTPSLRHIFYCHPFNRMAQQNFSRFLMTQVGSRLETLGVDNEFSQILFPGIYLETISTFENTSRRSQLL